MSRVGKLLARAFLWATRWKLEGWPPPDRRFVLIAAPHTSNWDLVYLLALASVCDLRISWMAKHTLFRPPLGWLFRALGGLPVRRHERGNLVEQTAAAFKETWELAIVVPAEGTRGPAEHWKSGFYHIARKAEVPIVMGFLDYARRRGGFGPSFAPSGDLRKDMDQVRAFYAGKQARYPDDFGPVRLREEVEDGSARGSPVPPPAGAQRSSARDFSSKR